jgi:hypothetical protein
LFRRPWFTRVWIIQEFVLPREILIICGGWELDGVILPEVTLWSTVRLARQSVEAVAGSSIPKAWFHQEPLVSLCRACHACD